MLVDYGNARVNDELLSFCLCIIFLSLQVIASALGPEILQLVVLTPTFCATY